MLEAMMVVANRGEPAEPARRATPRIDPTLRQARTCYDHLAGRLGVGIADALVAQGTILLGDETGEITEAGRVALARFGIAVEPMAGSRRLLCRPCLDWSERRPHLAGVLGAAICRHCTDLGWIRRERSSRAVTITAKGRRGLAETFGMSFA